MTLSNEMAVFRQWMENEISEYQTARLTEEERKTVADEQFERDVGRPPLPEIE